MQAPSDELLALEPGCDLLHSAAFIELSQAIISKASQSCFSLTFASSECDRILFGGCLPQRDVLGLAIPGLVELDAVFRGTYSLECIFNMQ